MKHDSNEKQPVISTEPLNVTQQPRRGSHFARSRSVELQITATRIMHACLDNALNNRTTKWFDQVHFIISRASRVAFRVLEPGRAAGE